MTLADLIAKGREADREAMRWRCGAVVATRTDASRAARMLDQAAQEEALADGIFAEVVAIAEERKQ